MSDRPLIDKWGEYIADLEAHIAGELDANTKLELRRTFISGAFAAFSLLCAAQRSNDFNKMFQHLADEGLKLLKDIDAAPKLHVM